MEIHDRSVPWLRLFQRKDKRFVAEARAAIVCRWGLSTPTAIAYNRGDGIRGSAAKPESRDLALVIERNLWNTSSPTSCLPMSSGHASWPT
jgi:hypothetical protein